jgi:hypothetical protein
MLFEKGNSIGNSPQTHGEIENKQNPNTCTKIRKRRIRTIGEFCDKYAEPDETKK